MCVCVGEGVGGAQGLSCCQNREPRASFGNTPTIPYCEATVTTKGAPPFCGDFFAPPPCSQFTIVFVWAHKRATQWLFNETGEESMCCVYGERFSFRVLRLEPVI